MNSGGKILGLKVIRSFSESLVYSINYIIKLTKILLKIMAWMHYVILLFVNLMWNNSEVRIVKCLVKTDLYSL